MGYLMAAGFLIFIIGGVLEYLHDEKEWKEQKAHLERWRMDHIAKRNKENQS